MLHSNYVIKSVSDLRQVSGFLRVLQFPPAIKLTPTIWLKYFERGAKHHQTHIYVYNIIVWRECTKLI